MIATTNGWLSDCWCVKLEFRGVRGVKERRIFNLIGTAFIAAGILLFVCPKIINGYNNMNTNNMINEFSRNIEIEKNSDDNILLEKLRADAEKYNENLVIKGQMVEDPFFYRGESIDLTEYGLSNNMFGYIDIPKMNVRLGIFLGATEENMNKGAVHLDNTSMPIGGVNSNCVIAAHRGNGRYGDMFRNIEKLEAGDTVTIVNPWEELEYNVTEIFAISPDDIDKILIQKDKDMVTLVTCHPYGSSRYRYIVYCERAGE